MLATAANAVLPAPQPIRCPACSATLGEIRDGVVVVDLRTGHGSGFVRTVVGALEIRCGRNRKGGPCAGIWRVAAI